ncbi:hypothetical protein HXX76_009493 [Chlamydomonas incerta]|uniref:Uncharacterized protein n=1 Tax=Chlamydomonas incerta TaxID=51695 RepID=A0A835T091_CHLIN|nr:hypothetical protein HXX76_009493 [Chlamydomonas incerta]|eukprot:KAG2431479.1 hypothetical protein HXX76_009493 [Chlamydomonas incerta]
MRAAPRLLAGPTSPARSSSLMLARAGAAPSVSQLLMVHCSLSSGSSSSSSSSSRCARMLRRPCPAAAIISARLARAARTAASGGAAAAGPVELAAAAAPAASASAAMVGLQQAGVGPAAAAAGGATRVAVGIDLGTTTSAVAVAGPDGRPRVVEDGAGRAVIPSVVYVQPDGSVLVGEAAAAAAAAPGSAPANAFFGVKRLIGRSYREALREVEEDEVQAAAAAAGPGRQGGGGSGGGGGAGRRLRCYELVEGLGGRVEVACPALGRSMTPQEVSAHLIRHLVGRAQAFLATQQQQQQQRPAGAAAASAAGGGDEAGAAASSVQVLDAVITVPAHYSAGQRAAVVEAARAAGLERVSLLQEPIAAAIAYGFGSAAVPYDVLLVFDLGGGTTDLTVVEAFDGIMEVIGTAGDNYLGGDDFTAAVAEWLGAQAAARQAVGAAGEDGAAAATAGAGPATDPAASLGLLRAAEAAKLALSEAVAAARGGDSCSSSGGGVRVSVRVPMPVATSSLADATADGELELSEHTFEQLVRPLMRRVWWPLERLALATRLQLGGRLSPELDPRVPLATPATTTTTAAGATANAKSGEGQAPAPSRDSSSSSSSAGGDSSSYSLASGSSAWDLGLGEGPGRRDGAAAWEFSIFPQQQGTGSSSGSSSGGSSNGGSKYVAPPRRLSGLVLVGAATRLPVVRQYITQVSGLPIRSGVDPETAVALGAALHAGLMTGRVAGGIEVNDGGYVAAQHGRASGFQVAVEAPPPPPPPQPAPSDSAPRKQRQPQPAPKQRRSASGRAIKVAVLAPRTPRAAPAGSGSSSDDDAPLVWEP